MGVQNRDSSKINLRDLPDLLKRFMLMFLTMISVVPRSGAFENNDSKSKRYGDELLRDVISFAKAVEFSNV